MESLVKLHEEKNTFSYKILLGPTFLLLSLCISSFGYKFFNYDLWGVAVLGLFLCSRWQKKGFFIALGILFSMMCFKHLYIETHHLWQFGLESSLALGFLITTFSFEGLNGLFQSFEENRADLLKKNVVLGEKIKEKDGFYIQKQKILEEQLQTITKKFDEEVEKVFSYSNLIQALHRTAEQNNYDRKVLIDDAYKKQQMISRLQEDIEKIIQEKEGKSIQIEEITKKYRLQEKAIEDLLTKQKKVEEQEQEKGSSLQLSQVEKQLHSYEKKIYEMKNQIDLYKQLQKQFLQKDKALHEARSEAFFVKEKLLVSEKEQRMKMFLQSPLERNLIINLHNASHELSHLEEENQVLENIISILTEKLSNQKKIKKSIKLSSNELQLPFDI